MFYTQHFETKLGSEKGTDLSWKTGSSANSVNNKVYGHREVA